MAKKITQYTAVTQPFIPTDLIDVSKHITQTLGILIVGKQYTILDYQVGDDFTNVANVVSGTINTTGCVFIATGTTPTNYMYSSTIAYYESQKATIAQIGGLPKIYKALLTQTGTDAPVATVLVNTLSGTPVWSYGTVGRYLLTLAGEFDASKTMIFISNNDITSLFSCYRLNDDVIRLECSDLSLVKADDLVNGLTITIEVYP